jgi:hypothetical protein
MMPRAQLEAWVLKIAGEALEANHAAATEVIQVLTGGHDVFCPQPHSNQRLHAAAAAFLTIARLS